MQNDFAAQCLSWTVRWKKPKFIPLQDWLESCLKQVLFLVSGRDDIREVVDRLIFDDDKHLTREEKVRVVENVLRECDNDEDGALCFPEFQQAMAKSPDFIQLFKMYI